MRFCPCLTTLESRISLTVFPPPAPLPLDFNPPPLPAIVEPAPPPTFFDQVTYHVLLALYGK